MTAQPPEADIENALSSLQRLSDEELERCIQDEEYFENFVNKLPQVLHHIQIHQKPEPSSCVLAYLSFISISTPNSIICNLLLTLHFVIC